MKLEELDIKINYSDINHIIPYNSFILCIFCRHCEAALFGFFLLCCCRGEKSLCFVLKSEIIFFSPKSVV